MRHVQIPADITLRDVRTKEPGDTVSFYEWVEAFVFGDDRAGLSPAKLVRATKMLAGLEKAMGNGRVWHLEDQDYDTIRPIVEEPTKSPGNTHIARQLLPFPQAILEATKD